MKPKNTPLVAFTCASLLGSAALSQAGVLVSEDFSYGDGGLSGQNGGTGFSNAWSSSTSVTGGVAVGNDASTRDLSTPFGNSGTLWLSFDWGYNSAPSEGGSYGGLTLFVGGSERQLIGNTWPGVGHDMWRTNGSGSTGVTNHPGMKTGVAKITLGSGATSTIELWVGPTGSPVDVSGPPLATATNRDLEGVNRLRINGVDFGNGSNNQNFDNLLIGTELTDVDATDAPPPPVSATWSNPAGGLWDSSGNWIDSTIANGNGSTANFNTLDLTADTTVDLDSPRTIGNLVFGDTNPASPAGWTLANNGNPANSLTLSGTTPTITVNALEATKTATISAVINGFAGLTKAGTGTLILSSATSYTGATTVSEGTLQVSGQPYFNIGRTTSIASGAVFELSNSVNNLTTLMPVSTITGAGTFRLSGNSTINQVDNGVTGTRLTIEMQAGGLIDLLDSSKLTNGGWQVVNWTTNQASMNIASGATFDIWDGQDVIIDALTGSGTVVKGHPDPDTFMLTLGVANGSGTFSGTIQNTSGAGAIALTKVGAGTQALSGVLSYGGNTTVQEGTLSIGDGGVPTTLSDSATVSIAFGATMNLNFTGSDTVGVLEIDGSGPLPAGPYNSSHPTYGSYFSGSGSLVVPVTATDYELWGEPYGLTAGSEEGDLDNDGLSNFEEYAFGLLPNSGTSVNPIAVPLDKASGTFSYTRRSDSGLTYSVWFSEDLSVWTEDAGATEGAPVPSGDNETVEVTLSVDPLPAKLFIQVRAD